VAIKEKSIPKTTSGKIQRRRTRDTLNSGGLRIILRADQPLGAAGLHEED
ncbi:unnamed protein product, partial [Discosporangium mesarthrocarpum]